MPEVRALVRVHAILLRATAHDLRGVRGSADQEDLGRRSHPEGRGLVQGPLRLSQEGWGGEWGEEGREQGRERREEVFRDKVFRERVFREVFRGEVLPEGFGEE